MTAVQLNIFDVPDPATAQPVRTESARRPRRIIRPGTLSTLTVRTSRRDLVGPHNATAALKAAFMRGDELTPMDALARFGMQANSFHRARDGFKKEGMAFIKTPHKANGKTYNSYKMDKENSNVGGVE